MAIKLKNNENEEPQVYGNENFGIPSDCSKKQKFSTIKLIFYIVAVLAICITGYKYYVDAMDRLLPEITYDKTSQPVIYHTPENITIKTQRGNTYDVVVSSQDSVPASSAKSASKGKSLFFLSADETNPEVMNLSKYDTNTDSTIIVDYGVTDFKVNSDGRYAAYKKGNALYLSDLEKTKLVHSEVSEYFLSANNQMLTFFSLDGSSMYTFSTAGDESPVLVNYGITKLISPKNEYANIYYIKNNSLYSQKYNGVQTLLCDNVSDAIMLGNTVYYTVAEEYPRKLGDFFIDDLKDSDELMMPPDGNDFISETIDLSFFDEQAFTEAVQFYEDKLLRDEIRQAFEDDPLLFYGYSLYMIDDDRSVLTDTHLVSPVLTLNSCRNIIAYKKYDTQLPERPSLVDITSLEEALTMRDEIANMPPDDDVFLLKEGEKPFFALELLPDMQIEISLDGKYLYCIEADENNTPGVLAKYEIGQTSLKNRVQIKTEVTDFALDGSDSDAVMVFSGNSLSMYYNNTLTHLSDSSCHDFFFVDGTLFYYDEYNVETASGSLMRIRNGEISLIDTNVSSFKVRRYNNVLYLKDVDPTTKTGTLYQKDGNKIKRLDTDVGTIVN